jgi:hypothetical protein
MNDVWLNEREMAQLGSPWPLEPIGRWSEMMSKHRAIWLAHSRPFLSDSRLAVAEQKCWGGSRG